MKPPGGDLRRPRGGHGLRSVQPLTCSHPTCARRPPSCRCGQRSWSASVPRPATWWSSSPRRATCDVDRPGGAGPAPAARGHGLDPFPGRRTSADHQLGHRYGAGRMGAPQSHYQAPGAVYVHQGQNVPGGRSS
ncbi:hypothetical protein QJS66_18750 [Kocuria rhizophila]|nr:hypothetical protein QJS66_18750 [Kocuria rhizophila]